MVVWETRFWAINSSYVVFGYFDDDYHVCRDVESRREYVHWH